MGGSKANSSSTQQTITNTVSDSYNKTVNDVRNLSDVGNVTIGIPGMAQESMPSMNNFLPIAVLGVGVVVAIALMKRRSA